jgi:hypothetical protein
MLASALSVILYEVHFKANINDDMKFALEFIKYVEEKRDLNSNEIILFERFVEIVTQMAYIMSFVFEYKEDYKTFKKGIKKYKWLPEVIEHFSSSFNDGTEREEQEELKDEENKLSNNELIAITKKYGFSFEELNKIKYIDLINILSLYNKKDEPKVRKATQEDFDNF